MQYDIELLLVGTEDAAQEYSLEMEGAPEQDMRKCALRRRETAKFVRVHPHVRIPRVNKHISNGVSRTL